MTNLVYRWDSIDCTENGDIDDEIDEEPISIQRLTVRMHGHLNQFNV